MALHSRKFTRDDGTVLNVDGTVRCEGRGLAWYYDEYQCWREQDADNPDAPLVTLTADEEIRLDEEVAEDSADIEDSLSWEDY